MRIKICQATLLLSLSTIWLACSQGEGSAESRLQVNQKYVLTSWPDSDYVTHLDSVLAAEPLKPNADSGRTELTIYSGKIPTIALPGQKKVAKPETPKVSGNKKAPVQGQGKSAENFAGRFMDALGKFQSDPSNAAVYRTVEAKEGEEILKLLSRAYGKDASKLPRFYTLSALQSVNPGIRLEHLTAGDKVRIPRLD